MLNTGHRRGGKASCCVGQGSNISFQDFSTFCPKAIAGIGKLPDTVADLAIPIRLKRAAPGEIVARFPLRDVGSAATILKERVEAWCLTIAESLPQARPELPDALTDRQQDGAEPLLAIADVVGGEWPEAARRALVELCTEGQAADDSVGRMLLSDIHLIFDALGVDKISSAQLVNGLVEIETSPWGEWSQGRPLTTAKLARLLRPYSICPHSIRLDDETPKGYEREDFEDSFRRYLRTQSTSVPSPRAQSATPQQANTGAVLSDFSKRNNDLDVAATIWPKANVYKPCCAVAVSTAPARGQQAELEDEL